MPAELEQHLVWVCCGCDNCGGRTPCDSPSADGAWVIKVDDLRAALADENGAFDSAIGQAITDAQLLGLGNVGTAREVRKRLILELTRQSHSDPKDPRA